MHKHILAAAGAAVLLAFASTPAASAAAHASHGQLLRPFNANQSNNWFGYNQGTLEQGGKLFHSISGDWTVPTATQHTAGQAESSSDWIGIGGGCVNTDCTVTANTRIQAGSEQDVAANGSTSYDAWFEVIPGPELIINNPVSPGDHIHSDISE